MTGYNLADAIEQIAVGFHHIAGTPGEMAANMLLILLMLIMLIAGLILWFVLVLRKVAILVVVAFAPLLIAGYLWAPTRSWVRRTTEVLVALVFTKTAIFALFGIGLALLSRGTAQTLSDFVGTTVLMCGACFAPLVMLRLVHFAADSHLAGEAIGSLRSGMQPVSTRLRGHGPTTAMGRSDLARAQAQGSRPAGPEPVRAGAVAGSPPQGTAGRTASGSSGTGGAGAGGAAAGGAGAAAGGVAAGVAVAGQAAVGTARGASRFSQQAARALAPGDDAGDRPITCPRVSDQNPDHPSHIAGRNHRS